LYYRKLRKDQLDRNDEGVSVSVSLQAMHIGQLPVEVIQYILKWVISSDLDIYSLEQLSCVSFQ